MHARLARDQLRAQIVGWLQMPSARPRRASSGSISGRRSATQRSWPIDQLVELAARSRCTGPRTRAPVPGPAGPAPPRRPRRRWRPARRARPGRSAPRRRSPASMVAARDGRSAQRAGASPVARLKRSACAPPPRDRPHRVAQVLLHQRDLGLHGERDVGQRRRRAAGWARRRSAPRPALLVHQAARAVDRIDDDRRSRRPLRACRRAARGARPSRAPRPRAGRATAATSSSKRSSSTASDTRSTA